MLHRQALRGTAAGHARARPPDSDLILPAPSEGSVDVAERVAVARGLQLERYGSLGARDIRSNGQTSAALIERVAAPDRAGQALLRDAAQAMSLSARGCHRVLKVARTVADLDGAESVGRIHIAEALSYRAAGPHIALAA